MTGEDCLTGLYISCRKSVLTQGTYEFCSLKQEQDGSDAEIRFEAWTMSI